jgi:prepilin-type processing-associated H-X9-DG protein
MDDQPVYHSSRRRLLWAGLGCLGLLAALAVVFPLFFNPCDAPRSRNACLSNVDDCMTAMIMYATEHGDHFPFATDWPQAILPYIKNTQIFLCPGDERNEFPYGRVLLPSYAMNEWANALSSSSLSDSETPLLPAVFDATQIYGLEGVAVYRHCDGVNVAFADGHGRWQSRTDFLSGLFRPPGLKVTPLTPAEDLPPMPQVPVPPWMGRKTTEPGAVARPSNPSNSVPSRPMP